LWLTVILGGISVLMIIFFAHEVQFCDRLKIRNSYSLLFLKQRSDLPSISKSGDRRANCYFEQKTAFNWQRGLVQLERFGAMLYLRFIAFHGLKTPLASIKEGCSLLSWSKWFGQLKCPARAEGVFFVK